MHRLMRRFMGYTMPTNIASSRNGFMNIAKNRSMGAAP